MIKMANKFLKKTAIFAFLPIVMYGCGSPLPDASDEQLIDFFSHGPMGISSGFDGRPKVVVNSMVECLAVLSGAKFDVFEAPPKELANFMRAECQSRLLSLVNNKNINVIGFKMKDFENQDLAKRVQKLREVSTAAYQQYIMEENKKREKEAQQREEEFRQRKAREIEEGRLAKQKTEAELKQKQDQYAAFVLSLDTRLPQLQAACDEHLALANEVAKIDGDKGTLFHMRRNNICGANFDEWKSEANQLLAQWKKIQVEGSDNHWYFATPYLTPRAEDGRLNYAMENLTKSITEMKGILGR